MTVLTEYEVLSIMEQYPRTVSMDAETGAMANTLRYEEARVVLFTSRRWLTNQTAEEREQIVHEFLTMVAHHEISERLHEWSPAHVGYTVKTYRSLNSPYLTEKAEKIHAWAVKHFTEECGSTALPVYESALR